MQCGSAGLLLPPGFVRRRRRQLYSVPRVGTTRLPRPPYPFRTPQGGECQRTFLVTWRDFLPIINISCGAFKLYRVTLGSAQTLGVQQFPIISQ